MAKKDWERNGEYNWIKRIEIEGRKRIEQSILVDKNLNNQDIVRIEFFQQPKKDKTKIFKTESEALKFADKYMRSH